MTDYKGKLILCSSAAFNDHEENEKELGEQKEMFKTIFNNKKVLVVLNASDTGSNPLGKLHTAQSIYNLGAKSVTDKSIGPNDFAVFKDFDVIYFMGGDCLPMIKLAQTAGFKDVLLNFLKSGKTIVGQSAGTLMFTKNLKFYYEAKKHTKPKYNIVLESYAGLGLVNEIFFPHYDKQPETQIQKIAEVEQQYNISFTKLNDGEFYVFDVTDLNI